MLSINNAFKHFEFLKCYTQVAACSDVALILAANSMSVNNGRQVAVYIGYDNWYTSVLTPNGAKNYM